ncbi:hypothetical protein VE04_09350, partial [Pseudogymnoascus sp. 24MN13]
MAETTAKRLKTDITIGTHNGHFHADEALAVYMLRLLPAYQSASLIRTRDPALLATCHTVVDVGGEYDATRNLYDHHQRTFTTTFPNRPTKLSSAGLVYMHFGKAIIAQSLGVEESADEVTILWNKIYEDFIEALDAHDNGISAYDTKALQAAGIEKRFSDGGFTLGAMVGRLNPNWNDPRPSDPAAWQAIEDEKFSKASSKIGAEFSSTLSYLTTSGSRRRAPVRTAFSERLDHDSHGRSLVVDGQSVPGTEHLYRLESEQGGDSKSGGGAKWRLQAVRETTDSFESRHPLPEAWRGFRDEKLDGITGVPGGVF